MLKIALAHFCEIHGPTAILGTQVSQEPCGQCTESDAKTDDVKQTTVSSEAIRRTQRSTNAAASAPPATPPTPVPLSSVSSPLSFGLGTKSKSQLSRDDACESCRFELPAQLSEQLRSDHAQDSPVLRTTQEIVVETRNDHDDYEAGTSSARFEFNWKNHAGASSTPPLPISSSPTPSTRSDSTIPPPPPSILLAAEGQTGPSEHSHRLRYVTTRQPASQHAYLLLRRSCIRTFSCENLPRGAGAGPLVFGDAEAGYSVTYIFRLPDPRARGHRRTYALIALGIRDAWRVSQAICDIIVVFEALSSQFVVMANTVLRTEAFRKEELERESMMRSDTSASAPTSPGAAATAPPSPLPISNSMQAGFQNGRSESYQSPPSLHIPRSITPVSSFLSAKLVDPDGHPRFGAQSTSARGVSGRGSATRTKGIPEILGRDGFFVELHTSFCLILAQLVRKFGVD